MKVGISKRASLEKQLKEQSKKFPEYNRGLFVTNCGIRLNSDANGSLQIMRRGFEVCLSDNKTTISNDIDFKIQPVSKGVLMNPIKLNIF